MAANLSISCSCPKEHIVPDQIVPPSNPRWSRPLSEDLIELFHNAIDYTNEVKLEDWQDWWPSTKFMINQWEEMNKKIINSKDKNGLSALQKASDQGNLEMVKYLLENDAQMNATPDDKSEFEFEFRTPIYMAVIKNHFDVVNFLMDHAASSKVDKA